MNSTDIEYVLHCIKNASELINQSESEKAKGLLLSAELLLSEKLTSDNSDYAKCEHERGSMVTENGQEWFVCKHCNKKYERYF